MPLAIVIAAVVLASMYLPIRNPLIWPFWLIWIILIAYFTFNWPFQFAKTSALNHEPKLTRRTAAHRIAIPALIPNAGLAAVAFVILNIIL
ncbi:MAG: hypothetical protein IT435_20505 [Phycisphaerales bacterium]|nr:hypothetical protein [Phycisphaerales bacterium]